MLKPSRGDWHRQEGQQPPTRDAGLYTFAPRRRFFSGLPTPSTTKNSFLHCGQVFSQTGTILVRVWYSMKTEQFGQITPVQLEEKTNSALNQ